MSKAHYLLSLVLSRLATSRSKSWCIIGFAWLAFDVAVHGSLLGARRAGAARRAGVRRPRRCSSPAAPRTIEAVSGLMNLVMLPMWVLSGVFFASTQLSRTRCSRSFTSLPLTALNDALRAVVNEGRSLDAVLPRDRRSSPRGERVVRAVVEAVPLAVEITCASPAEPPTPRAAAPPARTA